MKANPTDLPAPPPPPRTIAGLMSEFYGAFDGNFGLYQGVVRYWLMWRLPQITDLIQGMPGLKFHFCAEYKALLDNFLRLLMLPDLLVVGQCGQVLRFEHLQYEHPYDRPWPSIDGTQPDLGVIAGKVDRPLVDGVLQFMYEWVRPLSPSGRVVFAPFTSLLAGPSTEPFSAEMVLSLFRSAKANAAPSGLPGVFRWDFEKRAAAKLKDNPDLKSVPVFTEEEARYVKSVWNPAKMTLKYGRYFWPGAPISQPDPNWTPAEILAFESVIAAHLGCMLVVAGSWCGVVPEPVYRLDLRIPYVEGMSALLLARAMAEEPDAFIEFRRAISAALTEALNARGSEAFSKEVERIQRDIVDYGVAKLDRKWRELCGRRLARFGQYAAATAGLTIGLHFAYSPAALAGLFSAAVGSLFVELEKRMGEQSGMRENPMYFVWQLRH